MRTRPSSDRVHNLETDKQKRTAGGIEVAHDELYLKKKKKNLACVITSTRSLRDTVFGN